VVNRERESRAGVLSGKERGEIFSVLIMPANHSVPKNHKTRHMKVAAVKVG